MGVFGRLQFGQSPVESEMLSNAEDENETRGGQTV